MDINSSQFSSSFTFFGSLLLCLSCFDSTLSWALFYIRENPTWGFIRERRRSEEKQSGEKNIINKKFWASFMYKAHGMINEWKMWTSEKQQKKSEVVFCIVVFSYCLKWLREIFFSVLLLLSHSIDFNLYQKKSIFNFKSVEIIKIFKVFSVEVH